MENVCIEYVQICPEFALGFVQTVEFCFCTNLAKNSCSDGVSSKYCDALLK